MEICEEIRERLYSDRIHLTLPSWAASPRPPAHGDDDRHEQDKVEELQRIGSGHGGVVLTATRPASAGGRCAGPRQADGRFSGLWAACRSPSRRCGGAGCRLPGQGRSGSCPRGTAPRPGRRRAIPHPERAAPPARAWTALPGPRSQGRAKGQRPPGACPPGQ